MTVKAAPSQETTPQQDREGRGHGRSYLDYVAQGGGLDRGDERLPGEEDTEEASWSTTS